jgi:N-methylhydantoinase B
MSRPSCYDPIQVEVWRHLLASIAEEMGATLERTAYSPNIKERLDHSCALFDSRGRLLAQAAHIPVHLGAMPQMMQTLRKAVAWPQGVMWLCNDPRFGGTHLPDLTLVAPVYARSGVEAFKSSGLQEGPPLHPQPSALSPNNQNTPTPQPPNLLVGFVASRAHHADIGGLSPGSLPLSTELFHEGLILPPVRLVERGRVREDTLQLVCANSRAPEERRGDLAAQIAANETGIRRFRELVGRFGLTTFRERAAENIAYAAEAVRRALRALPSGTYAATDVLDDDGAGHHDIPIRVTITVRREGRIRFDFTGSAAQVPGSLNATEAITRSACYYVVRSLIADEIPTNEGCFAPVEVIAPEGSIVNARFPAAVAAGNVETSQRIVDVLLQALAPAAPERIPAASQGTMNNVTIGGWDPFRQRPFAYYETLAGGAGAGPKEPGASAIHTHMTNTRNTPVEALESHYPLRVLEYAVAEETGGAGRNAGGNGLIRRLELLSEAQLSLLTERRLHPPPGARGGEPGSCGANTLQEPDGTTRQLPGKVSLVCAAGTVVTLQTPGGGGWGAREKITPRY